MNYKKRNIEGYRDDTAYYACEKADRDFERFNKVLHLIFDVCDICGFKIDGRITLVDTKTGKIWK